MLYARACTVEIVSNIPPTLPLSCKAARTLAYTCARNPFRFTQFPKRPGGGWGVSATPIIPVYPERSSRRGQASHQITPIIPALANRGHLSPNIPALTQNGVGVGLRSMLFGARVSPT